MWKDIKNFEGYYEVNTKGEIRSIERKVNYRNNKQRVIKSKIKKQTLNSKGYLKVSLWKDNKSKTMEVQRIVAETFIENTMNKSQVNHIDGDKTNNKVENLEWCSPKENSLHRTNILKHGIVRVNQFNLDGKYINTYESIKKAAKENGIKPCSISNVINCKKNTAGGYYWALE